MPLTWAAPTILTPKTLLSTVCVYTFILSLQDTPSTHTDVDISMCVYVNICFTKWDNTDLDISTYTMLSFLFVSILWKSFWVRLHSKLSLSHAVDVWFSRFLVTSNNSAVNIFVTISLLTASFIFTWASVDGLNCMCVF